MSIWPSLARISLSATESIARNTSTCSDSASGPSAICARCRAQRGALYAVRSLQITLFALLVRFPRCFAATTICGNFEYGWFRAVLSRRWRQINLVRSLLPALLHAGAPHRTPTSWGNESLDGRSGARARAPAVPTPAPRALQPSISDSLLAHMCCSQVARRALAAAAVEVGAYRDWTHRASNRRGRIR